LQHKCLPQRKPFGTILLHAKQQGLSCNHSLAKIPGGPRAGQNAVCQTCKAGERPQVRSQKARAHAGLHSPGGRAGRWERHKCRAEGPLKCAHPLRLRQSRSPAPEGGARDSSQDDGGIRRRASAAGGIRQKASAAKYALHFVQNDSAWLTCDIRGALFPHKQRCA
jgi:hypothetical protein